jgi:hypothetical protein
MVCENEEIYDWMLLNDTLDFINMYLDCGLDSVENSIFNENSWYMPPAFTLNMYSFFTTNIFPKLFELLRKGDAYPLSDLKKPGTYSIKNSDFKITNAKEMELLIRYTANINKDYVLFVGKANYGLSRDTLDLSFDGNDVTIPVVKEPYTEKSNFFDSFIRENNSKDIFVNSDLCVKLDQEMKEQAITISGSKGSLYKKYGEIIALRNGFSPYYPKNPFNKDTKYFIRKDEKYILSIDLLHGHFEVFEGNAEKLWIAEYNFSGQKLSSSNMTKKQLEEMRNNHRVEDKYR